ncbi:MAG TPA: hypothetical protein VKA19_12185 [Alphaproteobacteria bacterium]|nr:hypothetical protein [Alphaproteobacteria bacterium]
MCARWKTFNPGIAAEARVRDEAGAAIDRWWRAFADKKDDIAALFTQEQDWDLPAWIHEHLGAIDPNLMWEFGPGIDNGHRLVITPENRHDLRPLVDQMLASAPAIDGWSFLDHRPREPFSMVEMTVEGRTGAPLAATGFKCEKGRFNFIDIAVEFPKSFLRDNEDLADSQAFVLIECLLGEEDLDKWVGNIDVRSKPWRSSGVEGLAAAFDECRESIIAELPDGPFYRSVDDNEWTLFELKPQTADDYPAQSDMYVGKSASQELWENAHSGVRFDSLRYSRHGEVFCYLKVDGSEGLEGERFQDKADIEDALGEKLRADGFGCCIGGGTGLRYSYVDLALTDLWGGINAIRQVLQAGNIAKRSWVQFFDADWVTEWVGVWDDSPAPPLPDLGD